MDKLKIMLVDDHVLFRKGLRDVIAMEDDMVVVAEASNGREAIELAVSSRPDVILMDVNLPGIDGIEATRAISEKLDSASIMMLTVSSLDEHLFEAIKAGAMGYVTKNVSPEALLRNIRGVRDGEAPLSRAMTAKILNSFREDAKEKAVNRENNITRRESEILELLAEGARDREIAEKLGIAENTVKKHVQNILRKLHVNNRTAAAAAAANMNRKRV
ncbi:MAG: response regulator transcription factor [Thermoleophilia bacterium]|nr:response regulator transcription factor [Thermoleophilia bacterium]